MILPYDSWVLTRLLCGQALNGELAAVSSPLRPLADHLVALPLGERLAPWEGYLFGRPDRDEVIKALANVDPLGPAPATQPRRYATAADVFQATGNTPWTWEGWIPPNRIVGIAAGEGVGKTRFVLDLCRRVWLNLSWPDDQPMTLPARTPSLWLCSDGQHDEIAETLPALGLPFEAVIFPAPSSDPYEHVSLDSAETIQWIGDAIRDVRPWALVIDSLTYATALDLCEQRAITKLKTPLVNLCQTHHINIIPTLHVSLSGQALGRRIKGITRTLLHLECPDPDQSHRLRLWVEKSYGPKPAALGVTIDASGNTYDKIPPARIERNKGGRPPVKREKAMQFIRDALARQNDQIGNDLCSEWVKTGEAADTFWSAVRKLEADGEIVTDGEKGTGKQTKLHLHANRPSPAP
jgi:hypothetical protein